MMIEQLTIIGVGLIGGSFARALRQAGKIKKIVGCGRNTPNLEKGVELGVIDEFHLDIPSAVKDADVIFISTPVNSFENIFQQLKGHIKDTAIITDGGSTKGNIVAAAKKVFGQVPIHFVPGHPIAGTENSGVEASFAELYIDHKIILTPLLDTDKDALEIVTGLWHSCGAEVVLMDVEHHDLVLGATSHLPHLLAFSLVNTLATVDDKKEIFDYAAGGFKDFTRIASSDPVMWQDICLANKAVLLEHLEHFQTDLDSLTQALENDDASYIRNIFSRAKNTRDQFMSKKET